MEQVVKMAYFPPDLSCEDEQMVVCTLTSDHPEGDGRMLLVDNIGNIVDYEAAAENNFTPDVGVFNAELYAFLRQWMAGFPDDYAVYKKELTKLLEAGEHLEKIRREILRPY